MNNRISKKIEDRGGGVSILNLLHLPPSNLGPPRSGRAVGAWDAKFTSSFFLCVPFPLPPSQSVPVAHTATTAKRPIGDGTPHQHHHSGMKKPKVTVDVRGPPPPRFQKAAGVGAFTDPVCVRNQVHRTRSAVETLHQIGWPSKTRSNGPCLVCVCVCCTHHREYSADYNNK